MKTPILLFLIFSAAGFKTSGQTTAWKTNQTRQKMDTNRLTDQSVRKAFDAWQNGDKNAFLSCFTEDAKLYDDGSPRDFRNFVKEACGHERFTSIESVSNQGKDIAGHFHSEKWGDFKTYFRFTINADGKFSRLDIGQAK